jgi:hypothetical protein
VKRAEALDQQVLTEMAKKTLYSNNSHNATPAKHGGFNYYLKTHFIT